jgi:PHD/YefM family antitoxin component YafN of YafNO toxin-antitoxin module
MTITTVTLSEAQVHLPYLLEETASSHQPITIVGTLQQAVLIAQEDWRAIQETSYLLSVPGMRESIQTGLATPVADCDEELNSGLEALAGKDHFFTS